MDWFVIWVKWDVRNGGWNAIASRRGREAADYTAEPITAVPCEIRCYSGDDRREGQELVWANDLASALV